MVFMVWLNLLQFIVPWPARKVFVRLSMWGFAAIHSIWILIGKINSSRILFLQLSSRLPAIWRFSGDDDAVPPLSSSSHAPQIHGHPHEIIRASAVRMLNLGKTPHDPWAPWQPAVAGSGFHLSTGPAKPPGSGTGIPVRFGRKPVGTGGIQIWIQNTQFNRFVPVYRPVRPVYRWFKEIFRRLQNRSSVWNKRKFRHELCKY